MFGDVAVFELKVERGGSFNRKKVQDHQYVNLALAATVGLFHKISDSPIYEGMKTRFTAAKPFDCLLISNATEWVVVMFYRKGQRKEARECVAVRPSYLTRHSTGSVKKDELMENGVRFNPWC